ncbi:MAG: glycosyltransferase family 39 protein [Anaerolineae bacterium]
MRTSKRFPLLMTLILLLACAAGLYHIQSQSIWFDEGWSAYAAAQPTLLAAWNADATNPPLYYVLLNVFARGAGDSELALRYFSLLCGLLVVALSYQLGWQLFGQRAGLMSALLAAFSPLLWWAGQEARMYTLLAALVLVCALSWHWLRRGSQWRWWLALWGAELALLYAHNTGPVVALWLNIITVLAWIADRYQRRSVTRRDLLLWLGGQAAVGVLWLPYFVNRFLLLSGANNAVTSTSPLTVDMMARLWQALWSGAWGLAGAEPLLLTLSIALLIITVLFIPYRLPAARWLVLHVLLLTGGLWLGLTVLGNEIHGRYLVMIAPLLLVALGAGLAGWRWGAALTLVPLVTFMAAVHFVTTNPAYQHDDARGMVQYYADHLSADNHVLMWSYADRYEMAYYWPRLGVQAERITLPEGADWETVQPLLPTSGDVALNVWYTQRADFRGMMTCALGDGTVNEPEIVSFYGMTDRLFRAPPLRPLTVQPFHATLNGATLSGMGTLTTAPADQAICLPVQITLTQPTTADLKVAVTLLNGYGWEIGRADAIFADPIQRTTSQLAAGDVLTAYPLLRLPYGAPAGQYSLQVRIYDEAVNPSGYSLTLDDGQTRPDVLIGMQRIIGSDWARVRPPDNLPAAINSGGLQLHDLSRYPAALHNGDILQLALLWAGDGELPPLTLADEQSKWRVEIPAPEYAGRETVRLDWRAAQLPLDAPDGTAQLRLADGTVVSTIPVDALLLVSVLPTFDTGVNTAIPGVGTLMGYTITGDMTDRSHPFELTLVWQAEAATAVSYTVFAQLVREDGQVLAQSDSIPVQATRPTTGWRRGEYVVDRHTVTFHADAQAGTARLIVGLYDAASGKRVAVTADSDFITLQTGIEVR